VKTLKILISFILGVGFILGVWVIYAAKILGLL